jgi:hypothetical protein
MTLTEFLFLLDLHGPDLARWPRAAAAPAQHLVAASADAAHAFAEAHRLDALLRADVVPADAADVERVLEGVRRRARRAGSQLRVALRSWGLVPLWPRVGLLAAALVLGLIVGAHVADLRRAQTASLSQLVWPTYGSERFLDSGGR